MTTSTQLPTISTCRWCHGLIAYRSCQQPDSQLVAALAKAAHEKFCSANPDAATP